MNNETTTNISALEAGQYPTHDENEEGPCNAAINSEERRYHTPPGCTAVAETGRTRRRTATDEPSKKRSKRGLASSSKFYICTECERHTHWRDIDENGVCHMCYEERWCEEGSGESTEEYEIIYVSGSDSE